MSTEIEILNDHYKDTHSHILHHAKIRERMIIFCGIVMFLMCFHIFEPDYMLTTVDNFIQRNVEPESNNYYIISNKDSINITETNNGNESISQEYVKKPSAAIGFMLWVLILSMCIKYCYSDLHLTRLYSYIEIVENRIHDKTFVADKVVFRREMLSYMIFKRNWVGYILSWIHHTVFVLLILAVATWKIQDENVHHIPKDKIFSALDWFIFSILILTLILHLILKRSIVNERFNEEKWKIKFLRPKEAKLQEQKDTGKST